MPLSSAFGLSNSAGLTARGGKTLSVAGGLARAGGSWTSGGTGGTGIALRSQTNTAYAASQTSTVLAAPAGLTNGDILLCTLFVGALNTSPPVTAPAGFAEFGPPTSVTDAGSFNGMLHIYWKRAAGESGSYTFTHASASTQGLLEAFSGCKSSGTPLAAESTNSGVAASIPSLSTGTSIVTTTANSWLLFQAHDWQGGGGLTPPTGMTEDFDGLVYAAHELRPTPGATGIRTMVNSNISVGSGWGVIMVELLPGP